MGQPEVRELDVGERLAEAVVYRARRLEGRLKTFIEAITENEEQCAARKDIASELIWREMEDLLAGVATITQA